MPFLPLLKSSRRPLPDQVYQFQATTVTLGLDVRHASARASAGLLRRTRLTGGFSAPMLHAMRGFRRAWRSMHAAHRPEL